MAQNRSRSVLACGLVAALLCCTPAFAQSIESERGESVFDRIHDLINLLGEKTEQIVAPHIGPLGDLAEEDWTGLQTFTRPFEYNSGALRQNVTVDFGSELAEAHVRIESWENPIAQITAEITVGAETMDAAEELANEVEIIISESAGGDRLDIRPRYPDTRAHGRVNLSTHFTLKVPATANVRCQNGFGDTSIAGIGGSVVLDSRFGVVDLRDIGGRAQVRAWGEFDLRAHGLRSGGTFDLQSSIAEFANCAGDLQVSSFLGSVTVSNIPADAHVRLKGESGALACIVPDGATPAVRASALYGTVHSDLDLERSVQGGLQIGRITPPEPTHHIEMDAMFADVTVRRESAFIPEASPSAAGEVPVYNSEEFQYDIGEDEQIRIDAIPGNVRVRGSDTDRLIVKVTRRVRVDDPQDARLALEALAFRHERIDGVTRLIANVTREAESVGMSSYRVDLDITCPRKVSIEVFADDGKTSIEQVHGPIRIEQDKGTINVEGVRAQDQTIEIVNGSGDVNVLDIAGNVSVITAQGAVQSRNVTGKQDLRTEGGNTLIESPAGEFTVRQQSGNVRLIALGGIAGAGSIEAVDGDISVLVDKGADVVFHITYENGAVYPLSLPLDGTIEGQRGSFTGRQKDGTHRLDLRAKNGNIYID